jgi:signal transduction histidine kinase
VALAFQPARRRMERIANRLVYGKRATPYEVLAEFSAHVAHAYDIQETPAAIAQIIAAGTGAARAEVWLRVGREMRSAARWPPDSPASAGPIQMLASGDLPEFDAGQSAFRVVHQGETLGAIAVQAKPGDRLSADHDRFIANLANQAGLALHNVRLLEDIRASRQRIVTAQDAAAQRLERNIHDGAQQQLVALTIKTRLAESLVGQDDLGARQLLTEMAGELQDTLNDLRDLARGIYPPLLAEAGLAAALRAQATKSALPVIVESDGLARYPAEAEAGVYYCALEALQNIAKYARASKASIRLSACDGTLAFVVEDDGIGFDPAARSPGSGIQGMSDRLAALGGELRVTSAPGSGTRIAGQVPVRELAAART